MLYITGWVKITNSTWLNVRQFCIIDKRFVGLYQNVKFVIWSKTSILIYVFAQVPRRPLLCENLAYTDPHPFKTLIFNLFSLVAPQDSQPFPSRANSLPGASRPRTLANSLPGTFAPWSFRSLAFSFPGTFALKSIRSQEQSLPGTFVPC